MPCRYSCGKGRGQLFRASELSHRTIMSFFWLVWSSSLSAKPSSWHISASWVRHFRPITCLERFKLSISLFITKPHVLIELLLFDKPDNGLCSGSFSAMWIASLTEARPVDELPQTLFWWTKALPCNLLALHCFTCVSLFSPRSERVRALGFMDRFGNASLIGGSSAGALVRRG